MLGVQVVIDVAVHGAREFDLVCPGCGGRDRLHPFETVISQVRLFAAAHERLGCADPRWAGREVPPDQ